MGRLLPLVALVLGLVAAVSQAAAQPSVDDAEQTAVEPEESLLKRKAQRLVDEGVALMSESDHGEALKKFRAAYELYPSVKLALNIGTALRHLGREAEAARSYEQYLAHPEAEPAVSARLVEILHEIDQRVGWLTIELRERAARVTLDGERVRGLHEEVTLRVDPGSHSLVAELAGRPATVQHFDIEPKQKLHLELSIAKPGEAPPEPVDAQSIVGWSMVGLGGAGVIVGAVVDIVAYATASDAQAQCHSSGSLAGYCTQEGADQMAEAHTQSVVGTTMLVIGGAVAVGGLVVVFTSSPDDGGEGDGIQVAGLVGPAPMLVLSTRW